MNSFRARSDLHLRRKLWHLAMGVVITGFYALGTPRVLGVLLLVIAFLVCVGVEWARLRVPALNDAAIKFWGPLMRESELRKMSGTPAYLAAAILAIGLFPKTAAILSLLYLAIGDPLASLVGVLYGDRLSSKRMANGKSWLGTLAGMGACFVITLIVLASVGSGSLSLGQILAVSLVGGVVGGGVELLPLQVDDNFIIPIFSGLTLWLMFILVNI